MTFDPGMELEALEQERFEADVEQAELERLGREYGRREAKMIRAYRAGQLTVAASFCPHGSGYPLNSLAATNDRDPHAGQQGVRCSDCGSRINGFRYEVARVVVLAPCEVTPWALRQRDAK